MGPPQAFSELRAIAGVAGSSGGDRLTHLRVQAIGDHAKTRQGFQRGGAAFGMQAAGGDHVAADGADGFFILQGGGDAGGRFIDHQAHGIGADIDDSDRTGASGAPVKIGRKRHPISGACPKTAS
jgi:hypothetical protein